MFIRTTKLLFLATAIFVRRVAAGFKSDADQVSRAASPPESNHLGIAFSGGGFKAVSDQTALTAGLLAVLMKRDPTLIEDASPLAKSGLYNDVSSLSTISGGSWFTSYLAYSKIYRIMVEKIAKQVVSGEEKGTVMNTFYDDYGRRFDEFSHLIVATSDPLKDSIDITHLGDKIPDVMQTTASAFGLFSAYAKLSSRDGGQFSWYSLIKFLLGDDINEATLGSEVQDWCKGKSWNIISFALTPSSPYRSYLWMSSPDLNKQLSYDVVGEEGSMFVPIIFSTVLGYPTAATPLPEANAIAKTLEIRHYGNIQTSMFDPWGIGSRLLSFVFRPPVSTKGIQPLANSLNSFADMPILGPVAASSAAVGFASLLGEGLPVFLAAGINANPAVCFACKKQPSEAFSYGQELIDKIWNNNKLSKTDYNDATREGVYSLIGGGATDPFGIATALASGAREIFCVNAIEDLLTVDVHFASPISAIGPLKPMELFQKKIQVIERETQDLELNSAETVKLVRFVTMKVKTVENDFFGIEADREVILHVFSALHTDVKTADMVGGSVESFRVLGEYIDDIMMILSSDNNKAIVDKMLNALKNSQ